MLYAIIAVLVIILDQWIKLYVSTGANLPAEGVVLIPNVLRLTDVKNDGAAFGLLSGSNTMIFIVLTAIIVVLVIVALATKFVSGKLARWSLVMIAAGGISNCIDRIININPTGYVQDMFQFEFAPWFPVFNLADIFITVFCVLFILAILFGRDRSGDENLEDEFSEDEDEAEEEEEEEKPRRRERSKKARRAARASAYDEDDDEDDDEDEEEEPAPAKAKASSRKARQARYEEEYEQYKAQQRARQQAAAEAAKAQQQAAPVQDAPAAPAADPFAEWERANARQQAQRAAAPAQPQQPQRPAAPVQPVSKPAVKTPEPAAEESFSLDDILAEFK